MTRNELKEILSYELLDGKQLSAIKTFRIKHITPATNFVYLCRKMWFHNKSGSKLLSKLYYLKIARKYNCYVFPDVEMGKGFRAYHPTGIVIGHCSVGENFTILQNVTIGEKNIGEYRATKICPRIGNNVTIAANSCVLGDVTITDNVVIGAGSIVTKDIDQPGVYVGAPAKQIKQAN